MAKDKQRAARHERIQKLQARIAELQGEVADEAKAIDTSGVDDDIAELRDRQAQLEREAAELRDRRVALKREIDVLEQLRAAAVAVTLTGEPVTVEAQPAEMKAG
jgi:predicted  nucleic acid-binding Zn-ribbon protein